MYLYDLNENQSSIENMITMHQRHAKKMKCNEKVKNNTNVFRKLFCFANKCISIVKDIIHNTSFFSYIALLEMKGFHLSHITIINKHRIMHI